MSANTVRRKRPLFAAAASFVIILGAGSPAFAQGTYTVGEKVEVNVYEYEGG